MTSTPEFSRPVPLGRLGVEPFRQEIAANEAERAALARRFDLLALDRLSAVVEHVLPVPSGFQVTFAATVETDAGPKPACAAQVLYRFIGP